MSSRGTVPAWVIEKQQKQIALEREAKRRKQVRQQIATVVAEVRTRASALNTQEIRIWAKDEFDFVPVILKGKLHNKDKDQEGWAVNLEITEIVEIINKEI